MKIEIEEAGKKLIFLKVMIRDDLKRGLIFGLAARLPIGIILGFVSSRHEVMPLM